MTRDDINSLAHSKWDCKYHVVFAPKYRRMVIYIIILTLCQYFFRQIKSLSFRRAFFGKQCRSMYAYHEHTPAFCFGI